MIPVVLPCHRRPDLLQRTLAALRADGVPRILAYSDGPRNPAEQGDVDLVRALLRSVSWCPVEIHERPANLGLGRSVLDGVTHAFRDYDAVIVVEDDLVCEPGTYAYLHAALTHYREDRRVMSVTGWTHPRITPAGLAGRPYFDGKAECWVWGAWRRSWTGMDRPALEIMADCAARGIDVERYGGDMPKMAADAGPRNLWAVGWWYHHMLNGGLCLRPPHSFCEHIGWDERATTTTAKARAWSNPAARLPPRIPGTWPEPAEHPDCAGLWRTAVNGPEAALTGLVGELR
jgi:Glycosyl transferase family 2